MTSAHRPKHSGDRAHPGKCKPAQFGKLFSRRLPAIDAQPLYLSSITINGAVHNVVYVVTQPNHVYAFDANSNYGANSSPLWYASMLTAAHGARPAPRSTVIWVPPARRSSTRLGHDVLVSTTLESGAPVYRLHALDVTSGPRNSGPTVIEASVPGAARTASMDREPHPTRP